MTPYETLSNDPAFKSFVLSRGWNEKTWNESKPWQRTDERVQFNGGLQPTGILRELPGAISETISEQKAAVSNAINKAGNTININ